MNLNLRELEKTDKFGFMFYIAYDGAKFHSFDEMSGKTTVKSKFKEVMNSIGFTWAKGIQQGGRTDAKVSANENILYVSSKYIGDLDSLKKEFNAKSEFLKVKKIVKTLPNLAFPDMVDKREYLYSYPQKKILNSEEEIIRLCREKSGTYDVSEFTDKKGLELKNHIRTVEITYENGKLRFLGDSFMPKQVRIMSSFILTNSLEPLPGKYLILEKIYLKDELNNMLIHSNKIDNSLLNEIKEFSSFNFSEVKTEKIGDEITIFYIPKEIKSEFIGKSGNNIKKLKKVIGNILVREI